MINKLLKIRGVKDKNSFLNPNSNVLNDPYKLKNIEKVAQRVIQAIQNNEKIAISNDVDTDGCTSTSMLIRYLKNFTDNIYYIAHNRSKGHGVEYSVDQIQDDTDLLLILDSSSNDAEICHKIIQQGIYVAILDHHIIENENPFAVIVNPQQEKCKYPNKDISTAGLIYKLFQILDEKLNVKYGDDYLDLCSIGLYGDMMPVNILENRYLIMQGMKNINNPGIKAILKENKIDKVDSSTIAFNFSPLINTAARMDNIKLALDLLLTDDFDEAIKITKKINKMKKERQEKEQWLSDIYSKQVNENDKFVIVYDEKASKNFNGLVAQQLTQKYNRPALVMRNWKGKLKGSFRSFAGFNVKDFLAESNLVDYSLGHTMAGGVGLSYSNLNKLKQYINNNIDISQFNTSIEYDLELNADEITFDLIKEIQRFNYLTGNGFEKATFKINNLIVDNDPVTLGPLKNTRKITCNGGLELMKFKTNESYAGDVSVFDELSVVGELNINEWRNPRTRKVKRTGQCVIIDYRIKN